MAKIYNFNAAREAKQTADEDFKAMETACREAGYVSNPYANGCVDQESKDKLFSLYNDNMLLLLMSRAIRKAEKTVDNFNERMDDEGL